MKRKTVITNLNFENLKLDLTDTNSMKKIDSDTKDNYIKLEIRLKNFMDSLIENTTAEKINPKIRSFLKLLITNHSLIPFLMT